MLRASHGGGIQQAPGSGLRYISVPHAVLLGSAASRSLQPDEAACAAACAANRAAIAFNFCPANATSGCHMDASLFVEPAGSCFCLAQTAIQTPSLLPLLGSGSSIATVAGAPLAPELAALPPTVGGYRQLPGYSLFGVGNTVRGPERAGFCCRTCLLFGAHSTSVAAHDPNISPLPLLPSPQLDCPESFQDGFCALTGELPQLTAACNTKPGCTTANVLLGLGPALRGSSEGGSASGSPVGVLKAVKQSVAPHQLCYTPFSVLCLQDQVQVEQQVPGQQAAGWPPSHEHRAFGTGGIGAAGAPGVEAESAREGASWSILKRPQAELRPAGDGENGAGQAQPGRAGTVLPAASALFCSLCSSVQTAVKRLLPAAPLSALPAFHCSCTAHRLGDCGAQRAADRLRTDGHHHRALHRCLCAALHHLPGLPQ